MNILSWNCRGLGNLEAVLALHNLVKTQEPKVLFLMETKLDSKKMEGIRVKLRFKFCFSVPSLGRSGGLALLWNDPFELSIQNFHKTISIRMCRLMVVSNGVSLVFMGIQRVIGRRSHGHS